MFVQTAVDKVGMYGVLSLILDTCITIYTKNAFRAHPVFSVKISPANKTD